MKAILHIGVENTGTTYLQQAFSKNREKLRASGILYPKSVGVDNHIGLAAFAIHSSKNDTTQRMMGIRGPADVPVFRNELHRALRLEVDESRCQTVLFSNEHCSSRLQTVDEVETLRSLIYDLCDEVRVLVYLRRQDDALLSIYSTAIRDGRSHPLDMPTEEEIYERYDYDVLLSRWAAAFGQDSLLVRRYDASDTLDDFSFLTGLPKLDRPGTRLNQRMNATKLEFLRGLNSRLEERDRGDLARHVGDADIQGPPLTAPPELREAIMARVAGSNRSVALEYFGYVQDGDPLFGPNLAQSAANQYALEVSDALDATAKLWKLKNVQSSHLWEHVQLLQKSTR